MKSLEKSRDGGEDFDELQNLQESKVIKIRYVGSNTFTVPNRRGAFNAMSYFKKLKINH